MTEREATTKIKGRGETRVGNSYISLYFNVLSNVACSRLSLMEANENSGERKIKRFKVRERERGGSGKEGEHVSIPLMPVFRPLFG